MIKELCKLTFDEVGLYSRLQQNLASYKTLLIIKRKNKTINFELEENLNKSISKLEKEIKSWWEHVTNHYGIPYYIDKVMRVDAQKLCVYIED